MHLFNRESCRHTLNATLLLEKVMLCFKSNILMFVCLVLRDIYVITKRGKLYMSSQNLPLNSCMHCIMQHCSTEPFRINITHLCNIMLHCVCAAFIAVNDRMTAWFGWEWPFAVAFACGLSYYWYHDDIHVSLRFWRDKYRQSQLFSTPDVPKRRVYA